MPTPDQKRLDDDRATPRIVQLWWALRPLTSVVRFMQSGAHPDDEASGMLAALAFRDGINLSYACSTRGEGGQNDIGTEAGAALGALRTQEMERACDILAMRMYWHSTTPDDTITDFGFSKSGEETLERWGRDRTLARFVHIVRTERPDILCPTFLDVPGQHGHHRAMTQAAHDVMDAAADSAFPSSLGPWQVSKLYLPAVSGAGQAYDDDEPPPPATLWIDGSGDDPVTGWPWRRIGQHSRAFHRTQGMGRWPPVEETGDWPLHLARSEVAGPDDTLGSGLFSTVGSLARHPDAGPAAPHLVAAQAAISTALAAFPDRGAILAAARDALLALDAARTGCPEAARGDIVHRLDAKEIQLGHVIRISAGVDARCRTGAQFLSPGTQTDLTLDLSPGEADAVSAAFDLPQAWQADGPALRIGTQAQQSDPFPDTYDPAQPRAPAIVLTITIGGQSVSTRLPFEAAPVILPARTLSISPQAALINLSRPGRAVEFTVAGVQPKGASGGVTTPQGWALEAAADHMTVTLPETATAGLYRLPVTVDGDPAHLVQRIVHDHTAPTAFAHPADLSVRVLDVAVPDVRIGYVGAGNDRVDHWLRALGADVTALTDTDLTSDSALASFDTIVIGIFAMRFRPGLAEAMPRLHGWTEAGGTLVTLYHRPWDGWDPETVPPKRLEIGQPSLRWRVTDERAAVRHLVDHPVLTGPNRIDPADWDGWVKERGLYFAKSWDDAYIAPLEMADPGETPHRGALLVADIGRGRHVHTSLILHHQMEHLVPGAFRLMANLVARRG
jgi:LmbE family N-acetylglucosaminyl deacetylase